MAKRSSAIAQYNAAVAAIKAATGVTHKEAQQAYRSGKIRLGHSPTPADAASKVMRQEASRAGERIRVRERQQQMRIDKAIAHARAPAKGRGKTPAKAGRGRGEAVKPRAGRPGGEAGGGGGIGGGAAGGREREPVDFFDFELDVDWGDYYYEEEDDS
jgi:hypothetical protein